MGSRAGPGDEHLRAPTAGIDDRDVAQDRPARLDPDEGHERFLLVAEDRDVHARGGADLGDDRRGVRGPPERIGAHDRDGLGADRPGSPDERHQRLDECSARGRERAAEVQLASEAEIGGFVEAHLEAVTPDLGDEEVDRIGADVDGGGDLGQWPRSRQSGLPLVRAPELRAPPHDAPQTFPSLPRRRPVLRRPRCHRPVDR